VDGQRHVPAALLPGKRPFAHCKEGPWFPGRSGRVRKYLHPPGFDLRTVQLVMCCCLRSRVLNIRLPLYGVPRDKGKVKVKFALEQDHEGADGE
jgi:hypothetical protein